MSRPALSRLLHWLLLGFAVFSMALFFWEQHRANEEAQQFRQAVKGAGAGQWYRDIERNTSRWDDQMFVVMDMPTTGWRKVEGGWGYDNVWTRDKLVPPFPWDHPASRIIPQDLESVVEAVNGAIKNKSRFDTAFRIVDAEGRLCAVRSGGEVLGGGRYMTGLCIRMLSPYDKDTLARAQQHAR